jgi:hypothetical protein
VYAGHGLAPEEEEEILAQADSAMKFVEQYVEEDIERILKQVPRDQDDLMSFHDMQKAVYKARAKHTLMLKSAMDRLTKVKNKQAKTAPVQESVKLKKKPKAKVSALVAPPNMFEKDSGMNDTETAMVVAKMLGKHSYKICQVETGNNPELTQNVKLLRPDFHYEEVCILWLIALNPIFRSFRTPVSPCFCAQEQDTWDGNCCLRGKNRATHVKSRNTPGHK